MADHARVLIDAMAKRAFEAMGDMQKIHFANIEEAMRGKGRSKKYRRPPSRRKAFRKVAPLTSLGKNSAVRRGR